MSNLTNSKLRICIKQKCDKSGKNQWVYLWNLKTVRNWYLGYVKEIYKARKYLENLNKNSLQEKSPIS